MVSPMGYLLGLRMAGGPPYGFVSGSSTASQSADDSKHRPENRRRCGGSSFMPGAEVCAGSVDRWIARDVAPRLGLGGLIGSAVNAGLVGCEAPPTGPAPQPLDRLGRRHGDWHDVLGRLHKRQIEERRQSAAGPDLGAGPVVIGGATLLGIQLEH